MEGIGVKDPPEYAVDDEVDAAVDGDQEVVGLGQGRELCLAKMLKYSRYNYKVENEKGCFSTWLLLGKWKHNDGENVGYGEIQKSYIIVHKYIFPLLEIYQS